MARSGAALQAGRTERGRGATNGWMLTPKSFTWSRGWKMQGDQRVRLRHPRGIQGVRPPNPRESDPLIHSTASAEGAGSCEGAVRRQRSTVSSQSSATSANAFFGVGDGEMACAGAEISTVKKCRFLDSLRSLGMTSGSCARSERHGRAAIARPVQSVMRSPWLGGVETTRNSTSALPSLIAWCAAPGGSSRPVRASSW
jgi:hypothetical protein